MADGKRGSGDGARTMSGAGGAAPEPAAPPGPGGDADEAGRGRSGPAVRRFRSISEEVADTLRDMILVGELRPGAQVTQDEMAARLGVSTMPVREALLRLGHEGLIEARRGRSYRVARITKSDVSDTYWLHATIEAELTRRACLRADDVVADLDRCVAAWHGAVEAGRAGALEDLNFRFHRTINQAAESPALIRQLRHTLRTIPQHFYSLLPEWVALSTAGHERILDAIRHHDAERAGAAAREHVLQAGELLITYFDDTGFWTPPPAEPAG